MISRSPLTGPRGCQGQAATEFTIIASFVLVPLFLLIPLLGRYIDIKQASVQQARFEAWEYTAWFHKSEQKTDLMGSLRSDQRAGLRELSETRARGNQLFFSDITAPGYGMPSTAPQFELNPLWVDHHGETLFVSSASNPGHGDFGEADTPDPTSGLIDDLISLINWVTRMFAELLHVLRVDADFNALNSKGYFTSSFQVDLRSSHQVVPDISNPTSDTSNLTVKSKASVLARGWTAGSTDNASSESRGLVLTSLLSPISTLFNKAVDLLQHVVNVAKHVLPIDIRLPHGPGFGHVQDDPIPYEHLEGDKRKSKEYKGLYYYAEE